jgi:hypothetical protein
MLKLLLRYEANKDGSPGVYGCNVAKSVVSSRWTRVLTKKGKEYRKRKGCESKGEQGSRRRAAQSVSGVGASSK